MLILFLADSSPKAVEASARTHIQLQMDTRRLAVGVERMLAVGDGRDRRWAEHQQEPDHFNDCYT